MSYDFDLFLPEEPLSREEAVRLRREGSEDAKRFISPQDAERLRQDLARILREQDPKLEIIEVDPRKDETLKASLPAGFELPGPHVEANDAERGIQIVVFGDEAGVSIAYWHRGKGAEQVLKWVWTYLSLLQRHGGYVIYDSQIDAPVDLDASFQEVLSKYREGSNLGGQIAARVLKERPPQAH